MARTIAEIQNEIIEAKEADATLTNLNSGSASAIWRLWTRVVAAAHSVLEELFDLHVAEVDAKLLVSRPHSLRWYQTMALLFQYGRDLPEGEIFYETGVDVDTVASEKVVAQAAAVNESGTLVMKVAREVGGELEPLSTAQYNAFVSYIEEVKDAGVSVVVRNIASDKLKATVDIYYDPQVLTSSGARIDGTAAEPVRDAAKAYMRRLPFNGVFVRAHFVDALQLVPGVYVPNVTSCEATRNDSTTYETISVLYQPYSGFLRFFNTSDLVLNFISQEDV